MRQLQRVERVAAALRVDRRALRRIQVLAGQRRALGLAQRAEVDDRDGGRRERRAEPRRRLARAIAEGQQHPPGGATAQERGQQLDRRRVAPVQVVEHQDQRLGRRDQIQQRADRAMSPMAFVDQPAGSRRAVAVERRQHAGQVVEKLGIEVLARVEVLGGDIGVEGVDPDPERKIALELRGRAREHHVAALLGLPPQLGQQPGLADPRFALDRQARRRSLPQIIEHLPEPFELRPSPDRLLGAKRHREPSITCRGRRRGRYLPACSRIHSPSSRCRRRDPSRAVIWKKPWIIPG